MEFTSTSLLSFLISEENTENYSKIDRKFLYNEWEVGGTRRLRYRNVLGSYERSRSGLWRSTRSGNNQRWTGNGNLYSPRDRKISKSRRNKIPWISVLPYKSNKQRKSILSEQRGWCFRISGGR